MSDSSVASALRTDLRLVVVEAPAGCGKTHQAAEYARDAARTARNGRVLILAHTHAACDVFASRTRGLGNRIDVRTIDSLIAQITAAYHLVLKLPKDTGAWARDHEHGYLDLAVRAAKLLRSAPMISKALALRYPVIICDEHQDASAEQEAIVLAFHRAGAIVRVFGDPMQRIFSKPSLIAADSERWSSLKNQADRFEELDQPHRWSNGAEALGNWTLEARAALRAGGKVDLRGALPQGIAVIIAENQALKYGDYRMSAPEDGTVRRLVREADSALVLTAHNKTVSALSSFFFRTIPIWEGHVRESLSILVRAVQSQSGYADELINTAFEFVGSVAVGFSASKYGNTLISEVRSGCNAKRKGKAAKLQELGRIILAEPNHRGVARFLARLETLIKSDPVFAKVRIDRRREFWDAIRLGEFDDPVEGFGEISRRRTASRPTVPNKSLSTIHKAKGLECDHVILLPCDSAHFNNTAASRCKLYVAISRASRSLTIITSRKRQSPLVVI